MSLTLLADESQEISPIIPPDRISSSTSPETELYMEDGVTWVYYNNEKVVELGRKKALPDIWVHPEPSYNVGRCKMIKRTGDRCRNPVRPGWKVCRFHGAGYRDAPGGVAPITGKYIEHLPSRYMKKLEAFLADPDYLSLRNEMVLIDTRIAEQLEKLDAADGRAAWGKVRSATAMLREKAEHDRGIMRVYQLLVAATTMQTEEEEVWDSVLKLIDNRRKAAEAERRRVEAAQSYLTLPEANAMMSWLIEAVMRHVSSPEERRRISEELRAFAAPSD